MHRHPESVVRLARIKAQHAVNRLPLISLRGGIGGVGAIVQDPRHADLPHRELLVQLSIFTRRIEVPLKTRIRRISARLDLG